MNNLNNLKLYLLEEYKKDQLEVNMKEKHILNVLHVIRLVVLHLDVLKGMQGSRKSFKPNQNRYRLKKSKQSYIEDERVTDNSGDESTEDSTSGCGNGKEWVFYALKKDEIKPVIKNEEKALA